MKRVMVALIALMIGTPIYLFISDQTPLWSKVDLVVGINALTALVVFYTVTMLTRFMAREEVIGVVKQVFDRRTMHLIYLVIITGLFVSLMVVLRGYKEASREREYQKTNYAIIDPI